MQPIDIVWIALGWLIREIWEAWEARRSLEKREYYEEVKQLKRLQSEGASSEEILAAMSPELRKAYEEFKKKC